MTAKFPTACFLLVLLLCPTALASGNCDFAESANPALLLKAVRELPARPDDEQTFYLACQYYLYAKSMDRLSRLAHEYLKKHPEWSSVHYALARYAEIDMDDDEALKQFKEAVRLKPCWMKVNWNCSSLLEQCGHHQECIDMIDHAFTYLHGNDIVTKNWKQTLFWTKATALKNSGRFAEAAGALNESMSLGGVYDRPAVIDFLGEIYVADKRWNQAIKLMTQRLAEDKGDRRAYMSRARAYAGSGQYARALCDLDAYLSLMPSGTSINKEVLIHQTHDARRLKAEIYEKMGHADLAAKERALIEKQSSEIYQVVPFRSKEPSLHTAPGQSPFRNK